MSRVLITGITGFTGRYLARVLEDQGFDVFGLSAQAVHGQDQDKVFHCDLLDRATLASVMAQVKPEYVVHLAAIAFVAHGDAEAIYRSNIVGSRNVLEAIDNSGAPIRAVLLASSANIYGNPEIDPLTEQVPYFPANDYAVSKVAMECMARLWSARLPLTIVRPFNYSGVGQSTKFLLPKIVDHFKRNANEIELGNLDVSRDFSDVRTVVDAYARLLKVVPTGETFNICSGTAHSLNDLINMMQKIARYDIDVKVNPAFVRENEVKFLRGSKEKIESVIGPLRAMPLESTLQWMFEA